MTPGHEDMNAAIRRAAGYAPAPTRETMPVADLGIGRGAGAAERRPSPPTMSALIRAEFDMRREERLARAREYDG
jgi:hypothetical protein